jgi:hypothetical protein
MVKDLTDQKALVSITTINIFSKQLNQRMMRNKRLLIVKMNYYLRNIKKILIHGSMLIHMVMSLNQILNDLKSKCYLTLL